MITGAEILDARARIQSLTERLDQAMGATIRRLAKETWISLECDDCGERIGWYAGRLKREGTILCPSCPRVVGEEGA